MADFDNVVSARRVPFETAVGRITPSKRGPTVAAAFVPDTKSDVSWGSHPSAPTSNCRMSMRWPTKLKKVGVQTDTLHSGGFMIANRVTSCRVDGSNGSQGHVQAQQVANAPSAAIFQTNGKTGRKTARTTAERGRPVPGGPRSAAVRSAQHYFVGEREHKPDVVTAGTQDLTVCNWSLPWG